MESRFSFGAIELVEVVRSHGVRVHPDLSTEPPLLWKTCFIQKHAVELLSTPSSSMCRSSSASGGSLITGAGGDEHLAAAVDRKVIVCCYERERDRNGIRVAARG